MKHVLTIARCEALRIFTSPLAWIFLGGLQLVLGIIFYMLAVNYTRSMEGAEQIAGVGQYFSDGLFGFSSILMLFVMPLMTMRLVAEERKSGSLTLLLASPVSLIEIVLGKFLGLGAFMLATLALEAAMLLVLMFGSPHLDLGVIASGLLGLLLLMMALGAAGLFASTLTREPTIAAVIGFALLLFIWILQGVSYQQFPGAAAFGYLSLIGHFQSLLRGVFDSADVIYYVLFVTVFLWLAVQRLDLERN
jgi:ABC-2 type transport system permease protein